MAENTEEWSTWGEFKRLVEAEGVCDEDKITFIDVNSTHPWGFKVKRLYDHSVIIALW